MKRLVLGLLVTLLLLAGPGLVTRPAQAQGAPQQEILLSATLAEAAARSFLVTLTRPELNSTMNFYLREELRGSQVIEELRANPASSFDIVEAGWLDEDTYRVTAVLQPAQRTLTVDTGKTNGRWRVEGVELVPTAIPSPADNAPAAPGTTAPAARPANPGLAGRLVFQTRSGGDIYVINADGTGLRRLTNGLDPQLSPDGSRVAFTRWEPRYELFTINIDGSGERAWAHGWRQMKSPTWSADGARLVFSYQSGGRLEDEERRIDLVRAAMNEEGVRVPPEARDVEVEDGILTYRLPMDANWYLQEVELSTKNYEDVPAGQYAYSPTGHPIDPNLLVYTVGGRGIALYNAATQTTQPVTTDSNDRAPVIAPDGSRVAVSYWQNGHWEVHTFNLDGSNRQRLTTTPYSILVKRSGGLQSQAVEGAERIVPGEQPYWNNAGPVWSPDGRQIAFMTDRTGRWEIWLMNADGSNPRPMFPNGVLDGLTFQYNGVDEHMLSWR